jgi:hypothetical protein
MQISARSITDSVNPNSRGPDEDQSAVLCRFIFTIPLMVFLRVCCWNSERSMLQPNRLPQSLAHQQPVRPFTIRYPLKKQNTSIFVHHVPDLPCLPRAMPISSSPFPRSRRSIVVRAFQCKSLPPDLKNFYHPSLHFLNADTLPFFGKPDGAPELRPADRLFEAAGFRH